MERGLYIAATGMLTAQVRQDLIANNLANINTVGYKGDKPINESFADTMLYRMTNGQPLGVANFGTRIAGTVTDFKQGAFRNTNNPFDFAISGDGFFQVRLNDGTIAYTRNGQFARNPEGYLTNQAGEYLLDTDRLPVWVGTNGGDPVVKGNGDIYTTEGDFLGQIGIAQLDTQTAVKVGDNKWIGEQIGLQPANTQIRQGSVEASSVNSVKEMVDMITTLRNYESSQRVITNIDTMLDKAVNSIGNVN